MKTHDFDNLPPATKTVIFNLEAQRDALLAALKELLPYAEKYLESLNDKMVGSLYPAINLAKLDRAEKAIAQAEAEGGNAT